VETVREPLVILDGQLRVQTANKAFYQMFTVTPAETENRLIYELGNRQWDIPALRKLLEEVLPVHKVFEAFEVEHAFPQIGRKIMVLNARGLYRADRPALILLAIEDITERKQEERLQASLHEKNVLLQEVHHRIKNNLQVISGLLHLQARSLPDAQVAALFRESESRVKAIALIHEKLYQSADFGAIDFTSYISILATDLFRTYQIQSDVIGLQISAADVFLDMERAVCCALILNELISNCLKHAFPAGRQGEIRIECCREANGDCRLMVADNGIGWPKEVDVQTSPSLGLRLVRILAKQLEGTLHVDSDGGAKVELQFPTTGPRASGDVSPPESK
jgi:PAS domain S-box-containing protein